MRGTHQWVSDSQSVVSEPTTQVGVLLFGDVGPVPGVLEGFDLRGRFLLLPVLGEDHRVVAVAVERWFPGRLGACCVPNRPQRLRSRHARTGWSTDQKIDGWHFGPMDRKPSATRPFGAGHVEGH